MVCETVLLHFGVHCSVLQQLKGIGHIEAVSSPPVAAYPFSPLSHTDVNILLPAGPVLFSTGEQVNSQRTTGSTSLHGETLEFFFFHWEGISVSKQVKKLQSLCK